MTLMLAALLGLVIGSFLNVVIHRLPKQLAYDWALQCGQTPSEPRLGLAWPGSHCPACGHRLRWFENVPVLSFIVQRGRCRACAGAIRWRYPVLEVAAAALAVWAVAQFGLHGQAVAAMVFLWALLALAVIDLETMLLPDRLTLGLLWLGLLLNLDGTFAPVSVPLSEAVWGAVAGYGSLAGVAWAYARLAGREGLGLGDAKLLAALGAWLGWTVLPLLVLLASVMALIVGLAAMLLGRADRHTALPFGPFLALAGVAALFWGEQWIGLWLR
ncbi:MAG: prepilin peptidase [Betaproteobacteria bacterium]|nr:MAG: prepilin peptidase [Betaproteobacteria bacterium]